MDAHLTIDKAGRIVIPKARRGELHLEAGDELEMERAGGSDHASSDPQRREPAVRFIDSIRERLTGIALTVDEYAKFLRTSATLGIIGGATYEALVASCAVKGNADTICTWNFATTVCADLKSPD